jgi:hypothetical protein
VTNSYEPTLHNSAVFLNADAIRIDYPGLSDLEIEARFEDIAGIEDGLKAEFDVVGELSESETMVLHLIANHIASLKENLDIDEKTRIRRRVALVDASAVLFGLKSNVLSSRSSEGDDTSDKYVSSGKNDEKDVFIDTCENHELSGRLRDYIFSSDMYRVQAAKLGVKPSFDVRVLDILQDERDSSNFAKVGLGPDSEVVARATANSAEYSDKFASKYGAVPAAWLSIEANGASTLFMRSSESMLLLEGDPEVSATALAHLQHELSHTEKRFMLGACIQIGKFIEERKAEALSGDMAEYLDIKRTFSAIKNITGFDITESLIRCTKSPDYFKDFIGEVTEKLGPHFALMLLLSSPYGAYDSDKHRETEIDVEAFFEHGDESCSDMLLAIIARTHSLDVYVSDVIRPNALEIVGDGMGMEFGVVGGIRSQGNGRIADLYEKEFELIRTTQSAYRIVGQ